MALNCKVLLFFSDSGSMRDGLLCSELPEAIPASSRDSTITVTASLAHFVGLRTAAEMSKIGAPTMAQGQEVWHTGN